MASPIERLLDQVEWREIVGDWRQHPWGGWEHGPTPVATHQGVLTVGSFKLRCYKLDNGKTVIDHEDVMKVLRGEG